MIHSPDEDKTNDIKMINDTKAYVIQKESVKFVLKKT